jgi:hypothetical protein
MVVYHEVDELHFACVVRQVICAAGSTNFLTLYFVTCVFFSHRDEVSFNYCQMNGMYMFKRQKINLSGNVSGTAYSE